jgi:hypothetical protein
MELNPGMTEASAVNELARVDAERRLMTIP